MAEKPNLSCQASAAKCWLPRLLSVPCSAVCCCRSRGDQQRPAPGSHHIRQPLLESQPRKEWALKYRGPSTDPGKKIMNGNLLLPQSSADRTSPGRSSWKSKWERWTPIAHKPVGNLPSADRVHHPAECFPSEISSWWRASAILPLCYPEIIYKKKGESEQVVQGSQTNFIFTLYFTNSISTLDSV